MSKPQEVVRLLVATAITAVTLFVASIAPSHAAEPKAVYVGQGRFICSGTSTACAQIDQNNRLQEQQRQYEYQREQDRAQAYVDRERQRGETERRYNERYRTP